MISEKESRKTVILKEIRSVKNTITGIVKERVVLGKEAVNAMDKSDCICWNEKGFCQKDSCSETQLWRSEERNRSVGADIMGTRSKKSPIVNHSTIK